jgi:pimeloyl-ACP methyl ester carboxylesterase
MTEDIPGERHDRKTTRHPADPPNWHHETAYVNDIELHYVTVAPAPGTVDHPTGTAPLVVLLHGFPECWYTWHRQLDTLADAGYRVVAPDLRGYNRSSTPAGVPSYQMDELVADVRGLVEHRNAAQTAVIGHDWGGLIGWECAMREPEMVSQLAVLNAPHPDLYRRRLLQSPSQLVRSSYVGALQLPWLPERLFEADGYRLVELSIEGLAAADAFSTEDVDRFRAALERSDAPSGPLNYYRAIARDTLSEGLSSLLRGERPSPRQVDVPTLVLWGEQDPVLGSALTDGLDAVVDDLRVSRFHESSHWPHAAQPQQVADELRRFLARSSRPTRDGD